MCVPEPSKEVSGFSSHCNRGTSFTLNGSESARSWNLGHSCCLSGRAETQLCNRTCLCPGFLHGHGYPKSTAPPRAYVFRPVKKGAEENGGSRSARVVFAVSNGLFTPRVCSGRKPKRRNSICSQKRKSLPFQMPLENGF